MNNPHKNARTTPVGRGEMIRRMVEEARPVAEVAAGFGGERADGAEVAGPLEARGTGRQRRARPHAKSCGECGAITKSTGLPGRSRSPA